MSAMTSSNRARSTQSTIMCVTVLFLAICVHISHAEFDHIHITTSEEVESHIASNNFILVVFCGDLDAEECEGEVTDIEDYLEEETIEGFPSSQFLLDLELIATSAPETAAKYGILEFPTIVFFRHGNPLIIQGEELENHDLSKLLEGHRDVHAKILTDANFEHDTQASTGATTGDWFIMFYNQTCLKSLATWESLAISLSQVKVVGRVDISQNPGLKKRFERFTDCPSFAFFSRGGMYEYDDDVISLKAFLTFAKGGYKRRDSILVPKPIEESFFSVLSTAVISSISSGLGRFFVIGGGLLVVILVIITVMAKKRKRRSKFE